MLKKLLPALELIWLLCFLAGFASKVAHDQLGRPEWLPALSSILLGIVLIDSSLLSVAFAQINLPEKKVQFGIILGIPLLSFGVLLLGRGLRGVLSGG